MATVDRNGSTKQCKADLLCSRITENTVDEVCKLINKSVYWTDDVKQRCRQRFKEVYENVTDDARQHCQWSTISDTGGTNTTEPFNADKKEEYNNLLPQLDELICSVAEKRKGCPFSCVKQQTQECKYLHKDMMMRKTKVTSSLMPMPVKDTSMEETGCRLKFQKMCSETVPLLLIGPKILDDASNLTNTLNMQSTFGHTCIDDYLFTAEKKMATPSASLRHTIQKHPLKRPPSSLAAKMYIENHERVHILRKDYLKGRSK